MGPTTQEDRTRTRPSARPRLRRPRRTGLAASAALVGTGAYVGALGLIVGFLRLPAHVEQRLPFGSPVLGGAALAAVVALPATVVAVLAWRADPRSDAAAAIEGLLLVGWIAVEVGVVRELSYLHLLYVAVGLGLIAAGRAGMTSALFRLRHRGSPAGGGHGG